MTLNDLGWRRCFSTPPAAPAGRIAVEHRTEYLLYTEAGELAAELTGRLRHDAEQGRFPGFPAVGDWVTYQAHPGGERASILSLLPRRSLFQRKTAGRRTEAQVVAANLDHVFLVTALDRDLNPRRLERYLALAWEGGVEPVVVLSKADLCPDLDAARGRIAAVTGIVPVHVVSTVTGFGLNELTAYFQDQRTIALLGSSGVGKSTLINHFLGHDVLRVQELRSDGRGRHTTTHRELFPLPGGGLLLDTPGMRELQLWEGDEGVSAAFGEVEELAALCRFSDCAHRSEPGCGVRAAVENGTLPAERLASYHKLQAELRYHEGRHDVHAQLERKRRERLGCKSVKQIKKKGR